MKKTEMMLAEMVTEERQSRHQFGNVFSSFLFILKQAFAPQNSYLLHEVGKISKNFHVSWPSNAGCPCTSVFG